MWKCLHPHFSGVHFLILFFKTVREELSFISPGNRFHNLAPKFETLATPYCVVQMFFRAKWLPLLKLWVSFSWKTTIYFIISGERSFFTLSNSVAKCCRFFIWIDVCFSKSLENLRYLWFSSTVLIYKFNWTVLLKITSTNDYLFTQYISTCFERL